MNFKALIYLALTTVILSGCGTSDDQIQKWVEKNPDKILQALITYQKKQQEQNQPTAAEVKANASELFENAGSPKKGNGPIKIAYFFDFNCGHCARQSEILKDVMAKKSNIQVTFKNFAVLGPSSELSARAALAAHQQGKYYDFYSETIKLKQKNPDSLKAIAKKLGLDLKKWEADMNSENVKKEIVHVNQLAQKMKLSGTPAIAIAPDLIFPGRVDQLLQIVDSIK